MRCWLARTATWSADLLDGQTPEHVVVFLLDGCNANLLADVIDAGEAPNLAGLLDDGTMYGRGAVSSLPTATLANHTAALTGAHPGHSGILHHAWYDRGREAEVDLLSLEQMFWSSSHLDPSTETVFAALTRSRPAAFSTASFEFCDTGATFSSFAMVRNGESADLPPMDDVTHLDGRPSDLHREVRLHVASRSPERRPHRWMRGARCTDNPLPTLSWCSLALTDEAGHEAGPHSPAARAAVRDSDARVGDVLAAVDAAGVRDRTAVVVLADHGMEETSDPAVSATGRPSWPPPAVPHLEVGGGLIYLT